jgi:peptide/nickel transport system ATP-binding protein
MDCAMPLIPRSDKLLLEIKNWNVHFSTLGSDVHAVRGVDISLAAGECLAVVGESGSGKSQLFQSVFGLHADNGRATGDVFWQGDHITDTKALLGREVGFIFQDPLTSLTPHMTIGAQMREVLMHHSGMPRAEADARSLGLLQKCKLRDPALHLTQYPHELSGGMRQRVMIAQAIANNPKLLIADEPTTALDMTVQAEILDLLKELQRDMDLAIAFITHDMRVAAKMADQALVMQQGRVIEAAAGAELFTNPKQVYTSELLAAYDLKAISKEHVPRETDKKPIVVATDIVVQFSGPAGFLKTKKFTAVDRISLSIAPGESLAIVGESGSGKSTLARAIAGLVPRSQGDVSIAGLEISGIAPRHVQTVFQDPFASLDPRQRVGHSVREALDILKPEMPLAAREQKTAEMFARVGLAEPFLHRYPHELSGGQCQRVGICRALLATPKLLICDEAISALDATTALRILELLEDIKRSEQIAMLFITHDLSAAQRLCERILVLEQGRVIEVGETRQIMSAPRHPRTQALLAASRLD